MSKVWFITGSASGLGYSFAEAALSRGDQVVATARDLTAVQKLVEAHGNLVLPLRLDVTDRAAVFAVVEQAHAHFGRLDVVVNNAGYGLFGAVEELSETLLRDELETNLLGATWVTQAVLPLLRQQGAGHIVQVSSVGGVVTYPYLGAYHASKWALEGLTQTLAQEIAGFGIKVTLVEPGAFATEAWGKSAVFAEPLAVYAPLREIVPTYSAVLADPRGAAAALLTIVDSDEPPLRVALGSAALGFIEADLQQRLSALESWAHVSAQADGAKQ